MGKNTSRAPSPQSHPKYVWPKLGEDAPRLPWADWLRLIALQLGDDYPGAVGQFLASHVIALALQAEALGATNPDAHERLAQEAADAEAAWYQALEHETMSPGVSSLTEHHPDAVDGWDGCPADDGAQRAWLALDHEDETYRN